jgi:hypothetical protein
MFVHGGNRRLPDGRPLVHVSFTDHATAERLYPTMASRGAPFARCARCAALAAVPCCAALLAIPGPALFCASCLPKMPAPSVCAGFKRCCSSVAALAPAAATASTAPRLSCACCASCWHEMPLLCECPGDRRNQLASQLAAERRGSFKVLCFSGAGLSPVMWHHLPGCLHTWAFSSPLPFRLPNPHCPLLLQVAVCAAGAAL